MRTRPASLVAVLTVLAISRITPARSSPDSSSGSVSAVSGGHAAPVGWRTGAGGLSATAGTIRGRVEIQHPETAPERRPDVVGLAMPPPREASERRQAVVYLETAPQPAFDESEPVRARMDQRNEAFVPHVLAIPVGGVVDFPNDDLTYHNVFSLSKARHFDLGRYAAGHSKSVRFDQPGIVRVFCDIHSHMNAYILVFAHRYFAVTDEEGRYQLERVPPGTYAVIAWYEGEARESRQVTVPPEGGTVDANFVVK
jgi:plastocyanin